MMTRRKMLALVGAAVASATLAGCSSFAPVYGGNGATSLASARFNFAPPRNRLEQIILNRLAIAFPNPAGPGDPVLTVGASGSGGLPEGMSTSLAVNRPVSSGVQATVTIVQGDQTLFTATRFTSTSYQSGKLTPTDVLSSTGAQETAARSTAESIRAAILAGYRPGMAPLAQPQ